jgi:hypothetical protein
MWTVVLRYPQLRLKAIMCWLGVVPLASTTERKMKKQERETKKESATSTNSRSLLGRGELRGTHGHQSNTLRGVRAYLCYKLRFLSIL